MSYSGIRQVNHILRLLLLLLSHPFNGFFSKTTWVNRYQKGKISLDLNEARDDGAWGCSGISWTTYKQSTPCSRQITTPTPPHSIFTGRMRLQTPNKQCQSTENKFYKYYYQLRFTAVCAFTDITWRWLYLSTMRLSLIYKPPYHNDRSLSTVLAVPSCFRLTLSTACGGRGQYHTGLNVGCRMKYFRLVTLAQFASWQYRHTYLIPVRYCKVTVYVLKKTRQTL